jgi:putative ABC transport system permease protein
LARVGSASIASALPLNGARERELSVEGQPVAAGTRAPQVDTLVIGPDYFQTLRIPLLRGHEFGREDGSAGRHHAIVNEQFAATYFGREDPIGRRIRLSSDAARVDASPWLTIVGVSRTVRQRTLGEPQPVVYVPFAFEPMPSMAVLLSVSGDASSLASEVRGEIRALDADLPVFAVMTMDRALDMPRWPGRFFRVMLTLFAIVGLVLSATGVYAVTAHAVTRRTREIGVRIALGARAGQVYRLVLSQVAVQFAVGLTLGLAGAIGVGIVLRSFLFQTSATDPATLAGISMVLAAIVIAACVAPARRAATLDPVAALRGD